MDESLEIVNHIYKDSEMSISTLTKLSTTLEKKDNKIKDTVEDIIFTYKYSNIGGEIGEEIPYLLKKALK